MLPKIFRRTLILYVLGLLIYVYPTMSISHQRLLGVLQRIAICYLVAALVYLYTGVRANNFHSAAIGLLLDDDDADFCTGLRRRELKR